jgi:glycosyltransferase involved in cell wall biosynthesis
LSSVPEIAVVVPTRNRALRLRWLLNALEEQDLEPERFEVVVAHNATDGETESLLSTHPLARRGTLRHLTLGPGAGPAALRNAAWRASRAPLIAFTDDDCRPPAGWLRAALDAATRNPGAIVQGQTQPDPDELGVLLHAPHARSQEIVPPHVMAQTCNIVYPRALLERLDGFDETFPQAVGEDTDLALRGRSMGAAYVGAPEVLTYHAVDWGLRKRLRGSWRWQHMALLVRKHPELRRELPLRGLAWNARHAWLLLAAAGLVAAPLESAATALLVAPWALTTPLTYGRHPRALARTVAELPARFVLDAVETAALLRGSARYRTLLL